MTFRPLRGRVALREEEDKVAEGRHRLEGVRLKGLGARQEKRHDGLGGWMRSTPSGATRKRTRTVLPGAGDSTFASRPRMTGMKRLSHAHHVNNVRPSILNRCGISRTASPPKPMIRPCLSV